MELSPRLYHWLVRPKWFTNFFINTTLNSLLKDFDFKDKNVLDFGCGIGSNCQLFDSKHYLGVDYDKRRIRYANCLYKDYNFKAISNTIFDLPDNSLDYVFIMAVLHHIPTDDIKEYFREFSRVLNNKGSVLVIEPCILSRKYLSNKCMKLCDRGNYIRTEDQYLKLFKDSNLKPLVYKKFKKCFYNEIFITASLKY